MAKGYAIFKRKLKELELELNEVVALSAETPCHQLLSEGLRGRFGFLRSLLAAEIKSQPRKPHHLHHIEQRLAELEAAFLDWDNFRTSAIHHLDSASTCSCTESCLNEDEDGDGSSDLGSPFYLDTETVSDKAIEEKAQVPIEKVEGRRVQNGKICRVVVTSFVLFVLVMMGLGVAIFSGCCYYIGEESSLIPT
uniref:DUF7610 domain-containing protein n=1 Tax=Nelumbo nucifera TaxID=4432 RepID=A0A822ZSG6_NELNU|nr:TPA_asm: hypothetical protein HUJ06_017764 [Nelumbo nucifera]